MEASADSARLRRISFKEACYFTGCIRVRELVRVAWDCARYFLATYTVFAVAYLSYRAVGHESDLGSRIIKTAICIVAFLVGFFLHLRITADWERSHRTWQAYSAWEWAEIVTSGLMFFGIAAIAKYSHLPPLISGCLAFAWFTACGFMARVEALSEKYWLPEDEKDRT